MGLPAGRGDQHGPGPTGPQLGEPRQPVAIGQPQIEHHDVEGVLGERTLSMGQGSRAMHREPLGLEELLVQRPQSRIVFHQQQLCRVHPWSSSLSRGCPMGRRSG